MTNVVFVLLCGLLAIQSPQPSTTAPRFRLIRSLSGPSGHVDGTRYVIDDIRSKFTVPPDNNVVVYFEWEGASGRHEIVSSLRRPDGRTASITPIQMDVREGRFSAYWSYPLNSAMESGIWQAEIRIDGEPGGSHPFELEVAAHNPTPASPPTHVRATRSMDDLYSLRTSLAWIYKLDGKGRRRDRSTGFVIAPGEVATSFASIDGASNLSVEFADGHRVDTTEVLAWSRLQDWAILEVATGSVAPFKLARTDIPPVGERLVVFNVEGENVWVIAGVDVTARYDNPPFGERFRLDQRPSRGATGGPMLNLYGDVVALLGGTTEPGLRPPLLTNPDFVLNARIAVNEACIPIRDLPVLPDSQVPTALTALTPRGEFAPFVEPEANLANAGVTSVPVKGWAQSIDYRYEFSKTDPLITFFSIWREVQKPKGPQEWAVSLYDVRNQSFKVGTPVRIRFSENAVTASIGLDPKKLAPGQYRVDYLLNGTPVWRTVIVIRD